LETEIIYREGNVYKNCNCHIKDKKNVQLRENKTLDGSTVFSKKLERFITATKITNYQNELALPQRSN
jgi:hypothetical protein